VAVLVAKTTYDRGAGIKGSLTWPVNGVISSALEEAFYVAFGHIEGTGKRVLHAVDCSGSMTAAACALPNLTACQAVSCLVMEAVRREHKHATLMMATGVEVPVVQDVMLFNSTGTMVDVRPTHKLADVMRLVQAHNFGTTDCAQPMLKAIKEYKESKGTKGLYDLFVVYTDNETYYAGSAHPSQLLDDYRTLTGLDAKMVVIATTPTSHTIAYGGSYGGRGNMLAPAPGVETKYTLNIAGFDLNGPELIRNFMKSGSLGTSDSVVVPAVAEDDGFELVDGVEEA
jgi:60 kDa SS-A/Ro ribonucleoprotein